MRLLLLAFLFVTALVFSASRATADLADAQAAYTKGDFETARSMLQAPSLRGDADALMLLAKLVQDGKGGAQDSIEAYKLYSLVFMLGEPDPRAEAAARRRMVSRGLTHEEILSAEYAVIEWVDQTFGTGGRESAVDDLARKLAACKSECYAETEMVFSLGPAAARVVPDLESLMTRDPMWMPRQNYAYSLAVIGTAAVPAMCRILQDDEELRAEGIQNLLVTARALQLMGPTAHEARSCLVNALTRTYSEVGMNHKELGGGLGGEEAADLSFRSKTAIMGTLITIGDPDRMIHAPLTTYFEQEQNISLRLLVAWTVGRLYNQDRPAIDLALKVLESGSEREQAICLSVLLDLSDTPSFVGDAAGLLPQIKKLAKSGDQELSAPARSLLEALQK